MWDVEQLVFCLGPHFDVKVFSQEEAGTGMENLMAPVSCETSHAECWSICKAGAGYNVGRQTTDETNTAILGASL